MMKTLSFLFLFLGCMGSLSAQTFPEENLETINRSILQAQKVLNQLEKNSDIDLFVAISKSMPRTSLEKLAQDAAISGIPLILQGVGVQPETPSHKTSSTVLQTYGRHWIARHLNDWSFITQTGALLQIDPKRFQRHQIHDVPQVILSESSSLKTSCETPTWTFRARGDVTLSYALETLQKELQRHRTTMSENDFEKANTKILEALKKLQGDF